MPIGRTAVGQTGSLIALSYDGRPEWKPAGVTIDWTSVAAVSGSDLTTPEGFIVKVGQKWLRYGTVLGKISNPTVMTLTTTGTTTAGTFLFIGTRPDTGAVVSATIAYNAAVAAVQTAMDTVYGTGAVVVSGAGVLSANVHTLTFATTYQYLTPPTPSINNSGLTGGTVAVAVTNAGANTGMYGPYDFAATDGRQATTRDQTFLLNESLVQTGVLGLGTLNADQVGVIAGGRIWKDRLKATTGTHSLANGPTFTELLVGMPRLVLVGN